MVDTATELAYGNCNVCRAVTGMVARTVDPAGLVLHVCRSCTEKLVGALRGTVVWTTALPAIDRSKLGTSDDSR